MAPPLPPKPKIGPLIRRTLFAAALGGVAGCPAPSRIGAVRPRIGAQPPRIGPPADVYQDAGPEEPIEPDTQPADAVPRDAAPQDAAPQDAAPQDAIEPIKKPPPRIGPPPPRIGAIKKPVRIGKAPPPPPPPKERIGPPTRDDVKQLEPHSGQLFAPGGEPVARVSLRLDIGGVTRIVATDGEGRFELDGLLPGEHSVVVRARGYAPVETMLGGEPVRIDLT